MTSQCSPCSRSRMRPATRSVAPLLSMCHRHPPGPSRGRWRRRISLRTTSPPTSSATSAMTPASIHFPPVNSRKPGLGWEFGRSSLISLIRQRPNPVPKPRPATGSSCATSGYPAYPPCTDRTVQDPKSVRSRANRLIRARFRLRPCPKKAGSDSSEVPRIQGPNCTAR